MVRYILVFALLLGVTTGCAMTYRPPEGDSLSFSASYGGSKSFNYKGSRESMFSAVLEVINSAGFGVSFADKQSGTISTLARDLRVSTLEADCGRTFGIDYLLDNRTHTQVSLNANISESRVSVRANILGEYKPGDVSQDITLTCVSKGMLEIRILQQIQTVYRARVPKSEPVQAETVQIAPTQAQHPQEQPTQTESPQATTN